MLPNRSQDEEDYHSVGRRQAEVCNPLSPKIVTVIEPSRNRFVPDLSELWSFREVVYFLIWRDLKVRYRQTYLGVAWAVLQPLLTMSVFSIFFGKLIGVPSGEVPYPIFVLCGLVPWNFFSRAISSMTGSLVSNQELVRRVYFPRMAIPLASMLSCIADIGWGFAILAVALAIFQVVPSVQILMLPVALFVLISAVLGIGLALSAVNVQFRDIGFIVPFALQLLLFISPVIYPSNLVPEVWRPLYSLNPMVGVVELTRWSLLDTPADWLLIGISMISAMFLVAAGVCTFARTERLFADLI